MIPLIIGPIIPGFGRDVRSWSILPRKYMEVSGKMGVPHGVIIPFWSDFPWNKPSIYPLVNVYQKNPRKITMHFSYHGKTHYIYIYFFFSMAMAEKCRPFGSSEPEGHLRTSSRGPVRGMDAPIPAGRVQTSQRPLEHSMPTHGGADDWRPGRVQIDGLW